MRRAWEAIASLLVSSLFAASALAIDPDHPLDRLQERQWTRQDGLPSEIQFLARTTDGFVWVVAADGLYVFDGISFTGFVASDGRPALLGRALALRADAHDGLWIAYRGGGVTRVRKGEVRHWSADTGALRDRRVVDFAFDAEGRAHAASTSGVLRLDGEEWQRLRLRDDGGKEGGFDSVVFGGDGALWARGSSGLWRRPAGTDRFEHLEAAAGSAMSGLVAAPDGDVYRWDLDGDQNLCRVHPAERAACWKVLNLIAPVFDAEGALWWGGQLQIQRLAHPDRLALDAPEDALAKRELRKLNGKLLAIGDRSTVWVSGEQTLTRLRVTPVRTTRLPTGALAPGDGGELWVASFNRGLMRVAPLPAGARAWTGGDGTLWTESAVAESSTIPDGMSFEPGAEVAAGEPVVVQRYPAAGRSSLRLDRARDGDLFLVTRLPSLALARVRPRDGTVTPVPLPPLHRNAFVRAVATDRDGDLWFGGGLSSTTSFYRLRDDRWEPHAGLAGEVPTKTIGFALDRHDRPWVFAGDDSASVLVEGRWRRFDAGDGLDVGAGIGLHDAQDQIWVLGRDGVAAFTGDRFVTLRGSGGRPFRSVTGMRQRADGELWFYGADGIVRIAPDEWRRILADPTHEVAFTLLDHLDGVSVAAMQGSPLPSVAETDDGRLWFAGTSKLFTIDPREIGPMQPAPPVQLRSLEVDGALQPVRSGARLPVGTVRVALAFSAPRAELPEHTRFRYRLRSGGEAPPPWLFARERREVVYHRMPPGEYRFEIAASDREGRWSEAPTALDFAIEPAFYQTRSFMALVAVAALLLLTALYLLRLRQVSTRIRAEMDARLSERERIARDLHDTLLQGVQALLLTFQAIANRRPVGDPERALMERALDRTQDVVQEGRDRIGGLRDPLAVQTDLATCLEQHAHLLSAAGDTAWRVVAGSPRPLRSDVHDQLLQIGREALANACRHARASQVRLELDCGPQAVTMTVRDDGVGLPVACLRGEDREGHWGLAGMRERARSIGAVLSLRNLDDGGAEVRVSVEAALAYPPSAPRA